MPAGYQELFVEQGSDFNASITIDDINGVPFNLSKIQIKSQIKKSYYSIQNTASFTILVPDYTDGTIILSLPNQITSNIAAGRYVYDVVIKDDFNTITRVLEGIVNVLPQVTVF